MSPTDWDRVDGVYAELDALQDAGALTRDAFDRLWRDACEAAGALSDELLYDLAKAGREHCFPLLTAGGASRHAPRS